MRWVQSIAIASVILFLLSMSIMAGLIYCPGVKKAEAFADIATWANRTTRHYVPMNYNVTGSAAKFIVDQKGTKGIGNMGIGDGSMRTLISTVNISSVFDPGSYMLPRKYLTGEIMVNAGYPDIVYGEPQREIFMESPLLPGTIYGKLVGLPVTGGSTVDIAVRTIGYEYFNQNTFASKLAAVGGKLMSLIGAKSKNNETEDNPAIKPSSAQRNVPSSSENVYVS